MENKKRKSTGLLLSILGVISLVLITAGVTYAFFSYAKQGEKQNTITTGSITFIYNETSERLNISDALPKADSVGISENANNSFTFTVTSTTPSTAYINYIVTARMDPSSTLPTDQVKLYLTSTLNSGNEGTEGTGWVTGDKTFDTTNNAVFAFKDLDDVTDQKYESVWGSNTLPANDTTEKVIYTGQVPTTRGSSNNYVRTFKMNMWLKGAEFKCFNGNTVVSGITAQADCTAPNVWKADTTGVEDYSAYEFVNVSQATTTDPISVSTLTEGTTWLKSVPYYSGLEATPATITASDWTRIAYVNYTTKQIITVAQTQLSGFTAPSFGSCDTDSATNTTKALCDAANGTWTATGWEASEQYYPFNGGTFKVTINVYAEGATTYRVNP